MLIHCATCPLLMRIRLIKSHKMKLATIHNIRHTRDGFYFQDAYALNLFFNFFLDSRYGMSDFFVDYPLSNQNSLDIKFIFNKPEIKEFVYEIKYSEEFAKKIKIKLNKELLTLYNYYNEKDQDAVKIFLLTAPYHTSEWREVWNDLKMIKDRTNSSKKYDLPKNIKKYHEITGFKKNKITQNNFVSFVKKLDFDDTGCDITAVEKMIDGSLCKLANSFSDSALNLTQGIDSVKLRITLMHIIRINAGQINNLLPLIINEVSQEFSTIHATTKPSQFEANKQKDAYKRELEQKIYGQTNSTQPSRLYVREDRSITK